MVKVCGDVNIMILYDIRDQSSQNEFVLTIAGIILIIAAVIFLIRVLYFFSGSLFMDKVEVLLNIIGVVGGFVIAFMFISLNINSVANFNKYNNLIEQNSCYSVTGQPTNMEIYNRRVLDEDLLTFEVEGVCFDTYNLFRTNNIGLSLEDVEILANANVITVKYVQNETFDHEIYNWILLIEVPQNGVKN